MHNMITKQELIDFEKEVARRFENGEIHSPVHLSGNNEDQLIEIFKDIHAGDWKFSSWRSHYHALLSGIPPDELMAEILAGHSMNLMNHEHHFFTSAIVGGILPIAVGVAAALKRDGSVRKVWVFVGDMTSSTGIFHESVQYAYRNELPIHFIIEDNGYSTDSPTNETWGSKYRLLKSSPPEKMYDFSSDDHGLIRRYSYARTYPHVGTGAFVSFV